MLTPTRFARLVAMVSALLPAVASAEPARTANNPFFALNNAFRSDPGMGIDEQVALLAELGYEGIGYSGLEGVPAMLAALDQADLKMYVDYIGLNIDDDQPPYDPKLLDVIDQLRGRDTILWFYILSKQHKASSDTGDERAVAILRELADRAAEAGLRIAIYPHTWFYAQRVEDAARLVEKVDRPNVGVTFNLVHTLKLDGPDHVDKALAAAAPHLSVVTINGADAKGTDWKQLIQPLGQGDYDVCALLAKLHRMGFAGPMGLQCYNITAPPAEHLAQSIAAWRKCRSQMPDNTSNTASPRAGLASLRGTAGASWLREPMTIRVRNEVTDKIAEPTFQSPSQDATRFELASLGLEMAQRIERGDDAIRLHFAFAGSQPRVGHEVTIDWPVLDKGMKIFTPSERGVMSVGAYPTYTPARYAHFGWDDGRYYVLPLAGVLNPATGQGMTLALPADGNIPHLQVSWHEGRVLRLTLGHRGMGGDKPSSLDLEILFHDDDPRRVIKTYSDRYPRYFKPVISKPKYQGSFWYHHIHDHPPFNELARQNVRFTWMSFWFTHLGEYLPDEPEWKPYTYAKWWRLGESMSDARIRTFVDEMHGHDIGALAYFNVTEYGGHGGESGDMERANRILRERFADALMKNEANTHIPTWEGAVAMNPRPEYALFPFLREQLRRHLDRLPDIDGFIIDRLDWASKYDYGHDDGLTMIGDRPADNMAGAVAAGVAEACRQAHDAGKLVYVNQFWRVEVLEDVDGYCCEYDNIRGLGYLSPYRPAAAWNHAVPYADDLLPFEAQLKRRLHFAVFPQMIAREFPISQQSADPEAAALLEVFAPLFSLLADTQQVLDGPAPQVTGPNDVNLFVNGAGQYVVPVVSRLAFLADGRDEPAAATITLPRPATAQPLWAHVHHLQGPPYRVPVFSRQAAKGDSRIEITLPRHRSASMVVIGRGAEPPLPRADPASRKSARQSLLPSTGVARPANPSAPIAPSSLLIAGRHLGVRGRVKVIVDQRCVGWLDHETQTFALPEATDSPADGDVKVELVTADEGTWFVPERILRLVDRGEDQFFIVGQWQSKTGWEASSTRHCVTCTVRAREALPYQP